ncbi:MAG: hypothetical protein GY703_16600 [Gammaproteobacteria bacterium]|nr:hypothetical protein [Gammaproteobacteria bacterium]
MNRLQQILFSLLACLFATSEVYADWINLSGAETAPNIAEIYVLDDRIKLVLEVYVGDIEQFQDLIPDDWAKEAGVVQPALASRLEHFSEKIFQFVTDDGEKLQARLLTVEPRLRVDRKSLYAGMINPLTRQRVPESPADKRVLYTVLEYHFQEKPGAITMIPPLDEEGRPTTSIGFIVYHKAVPVIDFRYLGQPAKLQLNWPDPWYSKFDNPNLKRHHKSAMMSFLYVEPYEVRHEILTRVKDLAEWMDLELKGEEFIEVDELEPLKRRIGEFLLDRNPVTIDGEPARPILDRSSYVKVALTGIQLLEKPERLEISTAIIGIILTYITKGIPQQVEVNWELFSDQIRKIPTRATDPAGPLPGFLTPEDAVLTWTNYLKQYKMPTIENVGVELRAGRWPIPLISTLLLMLVIPLGWHLARQRKTGGSVRYHAIGLLLLLAGSGLAFPYARVTVSGPGASVTDLTPGEAEQVLQALLKNVYRAFDFRQEEDVYDKLALTVSGDLLSDIYLQNRRSFAVQKAGGAQAKVKAVKIQEVQPEPGVTDEPGATFRTHWTASGSVGHWGHVHVRTNQYQAIIRLTPTEGSWKITGLELLEEQRIDAGAPGSAEVN